MDSHVDATGPGGSAARLPVFAQFTGAMFFIGTVTFVGRLIWEQTVWTWERGPQMIGFSLAHGAGVFLFFFPILLFIWTAVITVLTVWQRIKKRNISSARWAALGAIVLLFVLGSLPEGIWERAFIEKMAASPHAGDLMLYASFRGDLAVVEGLVSHGVSPNARDRAYWETAAHGAAAKGDVRMLRYLLSKGADLNVVNRSGDSPLELAISNHQNAAVKFMFDLGAQRIRGDERQRQKAVEDQVQEEIDAEKKR
jgi:hypothetical protein